MQSWHVQLYSTVSGAKYTFVKFINAKTTMQATDQLFSSNIYCQRINWLSNLKKQIRTESAKCIFMTTSAATHTYIYSKLANFTGKDKESAKSNKWRSQIAAFYHKLNKYNMQNCSSEKLWLKKANAMQCSGI